MQIKKRTRADNVLQTLYGIALGVFLLALN